MFDISQYFDNSIESILEECGKKAQLRKCFVGFAELFSHLSQVILTCDLTIIQSLRVAMASVKWNSDWPEHSCLTRTCDLRNQATIVF
jgi:hypothetical protein